MSSRVELFEDTLKEQAFETPVAEPEPEHTERAVWDQELFAEEQLRCLVRQIFFPGWSKSARQVVFTAVDQNTDVDTICMQVAGVLEAQVSGAVCVVQAPGGRSVQEERNRSSSRSAADPTTSWGGTAHDPPSVQGKWDSLRKSSRQISDKLWLMPMEVFLGEQPEGRSAAWLRGRLEQLRLDFDYTLLHAPAAGWSSEAALLGNMCDGVILVIEAGSTRRLVAQKVKAMLQAANARLLGTVLTERTFPIPEGIYRKL